MQHPLINCCRYHQLLIGFLLALFFVNTTHAQTTAFTYQGKLTNNNTPATGTYDMQFKLFDALVNGNQIVTTITNSTVAVANGVFSVELDFGAGAFDATPRFLEICVRLAGDSNPYTVLAPRQTFTAIPYAMHSANAAAADGLSAACAGCVTDNQINSLDGTKISGAIPVTSVPEGSGNYIQNSAAASRRGKNSLQQEAGFNIDGDGVAGGTLAASVINATTQFNFGGNHILSSPGISNLFAGTGAGAATTNGSQNAFFGTSAGAGNVSGVDNAFFGTFAGFNSTGNANTFFGTSAGYKNTGDANVFIGRSAGFQNDIGSRNSFFGTQAGRDGAGSANRDNAFFGYQAGISNFTFQNSFFGANAGHSTFLGGNNSFFGFNAGYSNFEGFENAFFGKDAGYANTDGQQNAFFGVGAGSANTTGFWNTAIGYLANVGSSGLDNATAIGSRAQVSSRNTMVLGSIFGVNNAINDTNVVIGATSGVARLNVMGGPPWTTQQWLGSLLFRNGSSISWEANQVGNYFGIGHTNGGLFFFESSTGIGMPPTPPRYTLAIIDGGLVGIGTFAPDALLTVNGTASKPGGGSWLAFSDERLKTIKSPFTAGLNAVMQLQPIRYEYRKDNALGIDAPGEHIGFSAQAVQKVIPEAVSSNNKGFLLVNNDPIFLAMLNAIKEQQSQIQQQQLQSKQLQSQLEQQQQQIKFQQQQIDALKKLICQHNQGAEICQ